MGADAQVVPQNQLSELLLRPRECELYIISESHPIILAQALMLTNPLIAHISFSKASHLGIMV